MNCTLPTAIYQAVAHCALSGVASRAYPQPRRKRNVLGTNPADHTVFSYDRDSAEEARRIFCGAENRSSSFAHQRVESLAAVVPLFPRVAPTTQPTRAASSEPSGDHDNMATAESLKLQGNACFQSGDFVGADKFYTQAIIKDPTNAAFFTNRALARVRMEQWDAVVADCEKAIELLPSSMKAYTYLGSALLHLNRPDESFKASHKAYQLAIEQRSPSIPQIAATCLEAKKKRWELAESERIKRESMLLRDTMAMIERDALERARRVGEEQGQEIMEEAAQKCRHLEEVFGKAEAETLRKRTVPDWLIDNITFGVMWDPVITKNGHSYDRATLIDHLRRSPTDPLTRDPLKIEDLRPNLALKAASEEFLKENGWAVDW